MHGTDMKNNIVLDGTMFLIYICVCVCVCVCVTTQNLVFLSYWYKQKRLKVHFNR